MNPIHLGLQRVKFFPQFVVRSSCLCQTPSGTISSLDCSPGSERWLARWCAVIQRISSRGCVRVLDLCNNYDLTIPAKLSKPLKPGIVHLKLVVRD